MGLEFAPLGPVPPDTGLLLHEAGYLPRNSSWMFPDTRSPFWRLYYNFDPGHQVVFAHGVFDLTPAHLMLIPDQQLFHAVGREPVRHFWLTFSVARRVGAEQALPILLKPTRVEWELLGELTGRFQGQGQAERERVFHGSLALLHLVLSRPDLQWQPGWSSPGVRQALLLMEKEYAHPLRLERLAKAAGLSVRGFAKAFQQQQGLTPARFLARIRVREACRLLANSARGIDEVATATGFSNRHHFSRVFKQITAEAPAQFRRVHSTGALDGHEFLAALSKREVEVLDYLAKGWLYKEVAAALGVSYGTIHTHIERLYTKLRVRSRAQAVAKYLHA